MPYALYTLMAAIRDLGLTDFLGLKVSHINKLRFKSGCFLHYIFRIFDNLWSVGQLYLHPLK